MKLVCVNYLYIPQVAQPATVLTSTNLTGPTPKGEISLLMGGIGWGFPLGNEGSEAFKYLCNLLFED